jgi:hemolysin-activating ACP:hemolysin acyltransferase
MASETADDRSVPKLRLIAVTNPAQALGLAVNHLMSKPAFAKLAFGDWSRILAGQINRGHYRFAVDDKNRVKGMVGWGLTSRDKAEDWVHGRRPLSYEDCTAGDCAVLNAWSADDNDVHRFLLSEVRNFDVPCDAIYFKRHYPDGRTRPVRLALQRKPKPQP